MLSGDKMLLEIPSACNHTSCKMLRLGIVGVFFEQNSKDLLQISGEMGDAMRYLENMDRSYYGQVRPRWEILND